LVAEVVAQEGPRLHACAVREGVPAADVEDVIHDATVKASQHPALPNDREQALYMLLAFIKWESRAVLVEHARSREDLGVEPDDTLAQATSLDTERLLIDKDLVNRALPALSELYREVVQKLHFDALTVEEAAAALGTSRADIRQRLKRAHQKLRAIIDDLDHRDAARLGVILSLFARMTAAHEHSSPVARVPRMETWERAGVDAGIPSHAHARRASPRQSPDRATGLSSFPLGGASTWLMVAMVAAAVLLLLGDARPGHADGARAPDIVASDERARSEPATRAMAGASHTSPRQMAPPRPHEPSWQTPRKRVLDERLPEYKRNATPPASKYDPGDQGRRDQGLSCLGGAAQRSRTSRPRCLPPPGRAS
jgi:RNA polymerase sigma factor (sigma-70 family)